MGAITHNGEVLQRLPADASQINFDNTGTNLNSTQTEAAIKEVNTKVNTNTDDITQLKSGLMSAAKAVYKDYHQIAAGGSYTFTPTLEVNHAYIVAICSGNNAAWGYCGIMLKGWEGTPPVLTDIHKGTYITVVMVDTDSIQVSNTDAQYNADSEIVVIDLGKGYQG